MICDAAGATVAVRRHSDMQHLHALVSACQSIPAHDTWQLVRLHAAAMAPFADAYPVKRKFPVQTCAASIHILLI